MRSRLPFLIFFFVISVAALPHFAFATQIPYFGPIVPPLNTNPQCAGNWDGFILLFDNLIAFALTIAITFFAPIMFAYAGFLYVINPLSPSGISKAKSIAYNTILGIVVALAAWLIVDAVLTTFTTGSSIGGGGLSYWSSVISGDGLNEYCLPIATALNTANNTTNSTGSTNSNPSTVAPSPSGTGACDPSVVQAGAAAGGENISSSESQVLACLASYESSCGADNQNFNWGKGSSAYGPFQVTLEGNSNCYNNAACDAAINLPSGTALNCASGFSGGNPIPGMTVVQQCTQAATNINCSAAAAACVVAEQGWSAYSSGDSNTSICVNDYGNSGGN